MPMQTRNMNAQRKIADFLGLLARAPRTQTELSTLTGMHKATARRWLSLLEEEGFLRVEILSREGIPASGAAKPRLRYHWDPVWMRKG